MKFMDWVRETAKNVIRKFRGAVRTPRPTLGAAAMTCAICIAIGVKVYAEGGAQSFNATNRLANGISIVNWPTNGTGTNTGQGINVSDYDRLGFYFKGTCTVVGTSQVTLVRAPSEVSPTTYTNWETVSQLVLQIPMTNVGQITWMTNLEPSFVRPGNWIGLNSATGGVGDVSGLDIGLTKKRIPVGK